MVAGPTSCGKTRFIFRLIDNVASMIEPAPRKIVYCYGEYQQLFSQYPKVTFHQGLPDMSDFDIVLYHQELLWIVQQVQLDSSLFQAGVPRIRR